MKGFFIRIDKCVNLIVILFLFWGVFWILNGADKFMDGELKPNYSLLKAVLTDTDGVVTHQFYPTDTFGWYGVNRNIQVNSYFNRLSLPKGAIYPMLYITGVIEIILGSAFLILFVWSLFPQEKRENLGGLFKNRTLHRLAFKGSTLVFVFFSFADIIFGDRIELWEHGTFIILCLITYDMWYRSDQFFQKMRKSKIETTPSGSPFLEE